MRIFRPVSPVFFKEMVQLATARRQVWIRLMFVGTLSIVAYFAIAQQSSRRTDLGQGLFAALIWFEMIAVLLLTPILTAGCIAGERQANTLSLLLLTPLFHRNIIMDKALSRIFDIGYLFLLSLPFMFLSVMLGGVEWMQAAVAMPFIIGTIFIAGAAGILFSTIRDTYLSALISTYIYLFVVGLSLLILSLIFARVFNFNNLAMVVNPVLGLEATVSGYRFQSRQVSLFISSTAFLVISIILFSLVVAFCVRHLRRLFELDLLAPGSGLSDRSEDKKATSFSRLRHKKIGLKAIRLVPMDKQVLHPRTLWTEFTAFIRKHRRITIGAGVAVGIILIWGGPTMITGYPTYVASYVLVGSLVCLMTMVKSATCFSQEAQNARLSLLLTTPATGSAIVCATYLSLIRS
ncbi:hypothetical protein BVY04_04810, partial [bacterium M21]